MTEYAPPSPARDYHEFLDRVAGPDAPPACMATPLDYASRYVDLNDLSTDTASLIRSMSGDWQHQAGEALVAYRTYPSREPDWIDSRNSFAPIRISRERADRIYEVLDPHLRPLIRYVDQSLRTFGYGNNAAYDHNLEIGVGPYAQGHLTFKRVGCMVAHTVSSLGDVYLQAPRLPMRVREQLDGDAFLPDISCPEGQRWRSIHKKHKADWQPDWHLAQAQPGWLYRLTCQDVFSDPPVQPVAPGQLPLSRVKIMIESHLAGRG